MKQILQKIKDRLSIKKPLKFKTIKSFLIRVIFSVSAWFGIAVFIFIIYFLVNMRHCTYVGNGVCQVSQEADTRLWIGMPLIFIGAIPLTYLIYKKVKVLFYIIAIPSFLFGLLCLLVR